MKISADKQRLETLGVWGKSYSYSRAIEGDSGEYKHLHYGDIHGKLAGNVSSSQLPTLTVKGKYEVISTGDVIFADASEDYDALGKASVVRVENGDKVLSGLHTHRFIVNKSLLDSGYLLSFTQSPMYKSFIRVIGNGVSVLGISKTNLGKLDIPLPSLAEQQKIAEFFSALDERIALTADKVKLLKEQKAGYLQQVFNRELVFTDDNGDTYGDWEEKRLGDLYRMASGMPFKGEEYQVGGEYSVITNANVQGDRYLDMSSSSHISAPPERIKPHQILKKGDILISLDGNVGRVSMVKEGKLLLAQRVGLLQPKSSQVLDNDFLYISLANDKFKDEMLSKQQGGGLKHIYARDVEGFEIAVPSLDEQKKIGSFFAALDEQLELTGNKLALLKEQKKGYLQGIFG